MAKQFDAYHELLGISPSEQPPNHYRLLGISLFEANHEVISNAAARQMAYVRRVGPGPFGDHAQRILNELAGAKLCLIDDQRRAAYDVRLRAQMAARQLAPPAVGADTDLDERPGLPRDAAAVPTKSWIVGATDSCDLVIDAPIVSSSHCRLSSDPTGYVIEDLHSMNGTYVNGVRIARQLGLSPRDRITLGRKLRLPWPPFPPMADSGTLRVGRDESNELVLNHPTVSGAHARLSICNEHLEIEDLDSRNGTWAGNPPERVTRAVLQPLDRVQIGIYKIPASYLLPRSARRDR